MKYVRSLENDLVKTGKIRYFSDKEFYLNPYILLAEGSLRSPPSRHLEIYIIISTVHLSIFAKQSGIIFSYLRKPRGARLPFGKILFDSTTHYHLLRACGARVQLREKRILLWGVADRLSVI